MMRAHPGWHEVAALVVKGMAAAIRNETVTYDLQKQGAAFASTSRFGDEIIRNLASYG